jgi:hypothetical protein
MESCYSEIEEQMLTRAGGRVLDGVCSS